LVERAAAAGVHVLCEKPMAMTAADCEAMIDTRARPLAEQVMHIPGFAVARKQGHALCSYS
jgi:predicted dehydrogenase